MLERTDMRIFYWISGFNINEKFDINITSSQFLMCQLFTLMAQSAASEDIWELLERNFHAFPVTQALLKISVMYHFP